MDSKKRFSKIYFSLLIAGALLFSGFLPKGILYDFKSYNHYKPAKVHGAPQTPLETPEIPQAKEDSLEFLAVGCAGSGNEGQKLLAESMADFSQAHKPAFVLYLGDNFYGRGVASVTDPKWQSLFESIYDPQRLPLPFYAVLGNHDHHKNPDAQIAYSKISPRWRMPGRSYTFEHPLKDGTTLEFFAVDTDPILHGDLKSLEWLESSLAKSKADWKIVFGHHPLYSGASTYRKQRQKMRPLLEPILTRHRVDLYLSSHNHSLEILKEHSGVRHVISGAGSRPRNVYWTDQTEFAHADISFIWIRISKDHLEVSAVGKQGAPLFYRQSLKSKKS